MNLINILIGISVVLVVTTFISAIVVFIKLEKDGWIE